MGMGTGEAPFGCTLIVAGKTFNERVKLAGPPGQVVPPADPSPPALLQTVVTEYGKVSNPTKFGVGGA
jgi:hypothetical protein